MQQYSLLKHFIAFDIQTLSFDPDTSSIVMTFVTCCPPGSISCLRASVLLLPTLIRLWTHHACITFCSTWCKQQPKKLDPERGFHLVVELFALFETPQVRAMSSYHLRKVLMDHSLTEQLINGKQVNQNHFLCIFGCLVGNKDVADVDNESSLINKPARTFNSSI